MASEEYNKLYDKLMREPPLPQNLTLQERRDAFERLFAQFPPPSDVRFEPFSIGPLSACWAFGRGVKRQPVLLFFHGGGYIIGSVRSHWGLMGRLSQASGCAVLGINYRLAPENPYPAALEDALTAYRWLLRHPYPPNQIAFVGDSCGGGLLLALLLRLKLEKMALPAAGVCLCPWLDLARTKYPTTKDLINPERTVAAAKLYYGSHDPKNPFISPLYGDLRGLPPLFIQAGEREILLDQIVEFAEKAKKSGVSVTLEKWPEMIHTWQLFASQLPEGQEAIDQIALFLRGFFPV